MGPFKHGPEVLLTLVPDAQPAVQGRNAAQRGMGLQVFSIGIAYVPEQGEGGKETVGHIGFNPLDDGLVQVLPLVYPEPVNGIITLIG